MRNVSFDPANFVLVHHWDDSIGWYCRRCDETGPFPATQWFYLSDARLSLSDVLDAIDKHETEHHTPGGD